MSRSPDDRGAPVRAPLPDVHPEVRGLARTPTPLRSGFVAAIAHGFTTSDVVELRASVARMTRSLDPAASVSSRGDLGFVVRLRVRDAPFTVLVEALPFDGPPLLSEASDGASRRVVVATSVRPDASPLEVSPRTWWSRAIAALRARDHVRTGDAVFDARFVVRGSADAAATLLTPEARDGLLALAGRGPVFLECAGGAVEVRGYADPTAATLERAFDVAASIRRASAVAR